MATMTTTNAVSTLELRCTPAAQQHIQKKLADKPSHTALRIRLKKAGCSGWLYQFEYAEHPQTDEIVCTATGGLVVLIPSQHRHFFQGAILDYVKSVFNGTLTCINPNEGARCGCGESFTVNNNDEDNDV